MNETALEAAGKVVMKEEEKNCLPYSKTKVFLRWLGREFFFFFIVFLYIDIAETCLGTWV